MRKKIAITVAALLLSLTLPGGEGKEVKAVENVQEVSVQQENKLSEGITEPKGKYLQKGVSSIGQIGPGKIKVSGTTVAQQLVSTIKISVMVERQVNGEWLSYTSWNASDTNAYALTTSKTMYVPRGYYYRVRSVHSANSDAGHSNTSAILVD